MNSRLSSFFDASFVTWWRPLVLVLVCHGWLPGVHAQAVWHCSKLSNTSETASASQYAIAKEDVFSVASSSANDVVGITVRDLIDAYSGLPIQIGGGRYLTACFMTDNSPTSQAALESLGLNRSAMMALARKSTIVRSQLQWVSNGEGMLRCMVQHYPAVGYFKNARETSEVAPCF